MISVKVWFLDTWVHLWCTDILYLVNFIIFVGENLEFWKLISGATIKWLRRWHWQEDSMYQIFENVISEILSSMEPAKI